jgi:hypothetical protein
MDLNEIIPKFNKGKIKYFVKISDLKILFLIKQPDFMLVLRSSF